MDVSITLTQSELWVLQEHVRQDEGRAAWDRTAQTRIHLGLLDGEDPQVVLLPLEYLWRAEGQINPGLRVGPELVGRGLLLKIFEALHDTAEPNLSLWEDVLTRAQEELERDDHGGTPVLS